MQAKRYYGFIKYKLKVVLPKKIWLRLSENVEIKREIEFAQRKIPRSKGDVSPELYVIRRRPPGGGLFSNINHVLQGIEYAKVNSLTPIVDMENYWTSYSQRKPFHHTKNAWEYFFDPVSNFKIDELESFRHVTLSKGDRIMPSSPLADRGLKFILDKKLSQEFHKLYVDKIRLNTRTFEFLNRVKDFIEWDHNSIGVSYRGTDYVSNQPIGHAKQPTLPQLISRMELQREKFPNGRLFISTEDSVAKNAILNTDFHSVYKDFRDVSTLKKFISNRQSVSKQTLNALGYLAEIYLLAECLTVTCSIANGSAMSMIINGGKYIEPDIIDLGNY